MDYQSPGRCCNIPCVINKTIHNPARGPAFVIHSFLSFFSHGIFFSFVGLFPVYNDGKCTQRQMTGVTWPFVIHRISSHVGFHQIKQQQSRVACKVKV